MAVLSGQEPVERGNEPGDSESPLIQRDHDVDEHEVVEPHDRRERKADCKRRDEAPAITLQSRLACQCVPSGTMDVVVEIPAVNKNLVKEGH